MRKQHTDEAGEWQAKQHRREKTTLTEARQRTRRHNWLIGLSYLCLGLAVWGVMAIYFPVAVAEASYQWKRVAQAKTGGEWWDFMVPNFSFNLVPSVIGSEWGLVIPKIYLQEKVVANVDPTSRTSYLPALQVGIAHAAGTELPGNGGLGYYFGHSSGMNVLSPQKQAAFYLLGKLTVGDDVYVYHYGEKYSYKVIYTQVVAANDVSFLNYHGGAERIVLQTCWPVGTSSKRLIVTAERV